LNCFTLFQCPTIFLMRHIWTSEVSIGLLIYFWFEDKINEDVIWTISYLGLFLLPLGEHTVCALMSHDMLLCSSVWLYYHYILHYNSTSKDCGGWFTFEYIKSLMSSCHFTPLTVARHDCIYLISDQYRILYQ